MRRLFHVITNVGRALVSRFFRTLFDGGVSEVNFLLKRTKEIFHYPTISIDTEEGSLITCFGKPSHLKVKHTSIKRQSLQWISFVFFVKFVLKDILILNLHLMI